MTARVISELYYKYRLKPCQDDYMKLEVSRSIKDEGELAQVRPFTRKVNRWRYMSEKKLLFVYFTVIIKDESSYRVTEGRHKVNIQVQLSPVQSKKATKLTEVLRSLHSIVNIGENLLRKMLVMGHILSFIAQGNLEFVVCL